MFKVTHSDGGDNKKTASESVTPSGRSSPCTSLRQSTDSRILSYPGGVTPYAVGPLLPQRHILSVVQPQPPARLLPFPNLRPLTSPDAPDSVSTAAVPGPTPCGSGSPYRPRISVFWGKTAVSNARRLG